MKRKRTVKETSAKSLVFDPLFRPRQETAKKGKGSYARRPRNQSQDSGPFSFYDVSAAARAENTLHPVHTRVALRRRHFVAPAGWRGFIRDFSLASYSISTHRG